MSQWARLYIYFVLLASALFTGLALTEPIRFASAWPAFLILTMLATLAQLLKALLKSDQLSGRGTTAYSPMLVILFAGIYLLPLPLYVPLVVIPHLVDWIKERLTNSSNLAKWYMQPFNIATHLLTGIAARQIFIALVPNSAPFTTLHPMLVVMLGALVYVLLNHLLIGLAIILAQGVSLQESGVFDFVNVGSDLVQLCLGYVVAVLWRLNPLLVVPALSPLVMIYRALTVPQLKKDAQTDLKTGLVNAGYFARLFRAEFERAKSIEQPLSVIMADLDLLRNINNTYGHLAGDAVLVGVAHVIRDMVCYNGIAGRFGGEEFSIVLPKTDGAEAEEIAERIRQTVAMTGFQVDTSPQPIHVTMSMGVASFPADAITSKDLIHEADVAVYQAKLRGRNCVVRASAVPRSIKLESVSTDARLESPYAAAFTPRLMIENSPRSEGMASGPRLAGSATPIQPKIPASADAESHSHSAQLLRLFVGGVVLAGIVVALAGMALDPPHDWLAIGLLVLLGGIAEFFQIDLYGDGTISVSVSIVFTAAIVTGVPGIVLTSASIALVHYLRRRIALYKSAFNWATHIMAGLAPVLVIYAQDIPLRVSNLPLLAVLTVLAALAYFGIDTGLVATAISISEERKLGVTWREQYLWLAYHYVELCLMGMFLGLAYLSLGVLGILVFTFPIIMLRYAQRQYVSRTEESVRELKRMNQELTRANSEIASASRAIRQLNDELFLTLSKIIDARDPFAAGHAVKVADYAAVMAIEMGLSPERLEPIRQAALLHDIGKLGLPEAILHKPAKLSDEEYTHIQTHATLGAEFLQTCQGLRHLASFVRHHHEEWDGSGYPDGLRADQIPLEARILAVSDAVEAMASDRPYHQAMSSSEIVAELQRCAGLQFDPAVVDAFIHVAEREGDRFVINSAREVAGYQVSRPEVGKSYDGGHPTPQLAIGNLEFTKSWERNFQAAQSGNGPG